MKDHRELLKELNRHAENRRIREIEKENTPLFYGMILMTAIMMALIIYLASDIIDLHRRAVEAETILNTRGMTCKKLLADPMVQRIMEAR